MFITVRPSSTDNASLNINKTKYYIATVTGCVGEMDTLSNTQCLLLDNDRHVFSKKHNIAEPVTKYNADVVPLDTKMVCSASWTPAKVARV
jgi:hypothetical protein